MKTVGAPSCVRNRISKRGNPLCRHAFGDGNRVAAGAGFENVGIEPTRVYSIEDARDFLSGRGLNVDKLARAVEGKFISAFIRASKTRKSVIGLRCV
jgi:hypothetical protein